MARFKLPSFKLRTFLIVIGLLAIPFAMLGHRMRRAKIQKDAVAKAEDLGIRVGYEDPWFDKPGEVPETWISKTFGLDFVASVARIELEGDLKDAGPAESLLRLGNVQHLICYSDNLDLELVRHCQLKIARLRQPGLTDLSPLKNQRELVSLDVFGGPIQSIAPLSGLIKLEYLGLDRTFVDDCSPLESLTELRELFLFSRTDAQDLTQARTNNIRFMKRMTKLTEVTICDDALVSLDGMEHAHELSTLILECPRLTDMSALQNLSALHNLTLESDAITDISPLAKMGPDRLTLITPKVTDLSALHRCNYMEWFTLEANSTDSSWIGEMSVLSALDIKGCRFKSLEGFEKLDWLQFLHLEGTDISDLTPITQLPNLESLGLVGSNVTDASVLSELETLRDLGISDSPLTVGPSNFKSYLHSLRLNNTPLENAADLTHAWVLNLSGTKIRNIDFVLGLHYRVLDISNTAVSDLSPLANVKISERLDISGTKVVDLSPLAKQKGSLRYLYMYDSMVTDLSPLLPIKSIETVYVSKNFPQSAIDALGTNGSFEVHRGRLEKR